MKHLFPLFVTLLLVLSCQTVDQKSEESSPVSSSIADGLISELMEKHGPGHEFRLNRGVCQVASLWRSSDGSPDDFTNFVRENFISDPEELDLVFDRLANNFQYLYGYLNRISLELNRQIHEDRGPVHAIDRLFSAYSPAAHVQSDLYRNRIAFIIALNFPHYSLEEKNEKGGSWTPREWGYARLGEMFTARVPPRLVQQAGQASSSAGLYISEYNIYAGKLLDEEGKTRFPQEMKLLAHWNLRDEIKSNYADPDGLVKQEMLYQVMRRIISQDIPQQVINNPGYHWNPFTNDLFLEGKPVAVNPEQTVRYEHLLANFKALSAMDPYYPNLDTYIKRRFESVMEIPMEEVESLFREYLASPLVRETGKRISRRLGRPLRPFDIWYDGFKARSALPETELDKITRKRYPDASAMNDDLPRILGEVGFQPEMARFLASKIEVDAARGSGHAWRASMPEKPSHLRTRVGRDGMDYKGYNIAIHELGHNVEQTISVHKVDNYFINGIPNTAFTEALAFMFQARDLDFLGMSGADPMAEHLEVLDVFWNNYEMMGVSLVDIGVWKWLYDNPEATAAELREAVIRIAKEIWNDYYADVFGERDVPLLAIYSHMIQSPLYLMNYPYGRLIMFQLEEHYRDRSFADETLRIFSLGKLTPRHWMEQATGRQISNDPVFQAAEKALKMTESDY